MSTHLTVDELLERNQRIATTHKPWPSLPEFLARGKPTTLIVACLDPRSEPKDIFGIQPSEAFVIRNAGGRVAPIIAEIIALDHTFKFECFIVIHHTDCGTSYISSDDIRTSLKHDHAGKTEEIDALTLPCITDFSESVREDLKLFRESGLVREDLRNKTTGYVYDIKTGKLSTV